MIEAAKYSVNVTLVFDSYFVKVFSSFNMLEKLNRNYFYLTDNCKNTFDLLLNIRRLFEIETYKISSMKYNITNLLHKAKVT